MARYQTKPVVIDAEQFKADDASTHDGVNYGLDIPDPEGDTFLEDKHWLLTKIGPVVVKDGDWIVTHANTDRCRVSQADFEAIYEPS